MERRLHFILQGKGGVGQSVVAALIAQYCRAIFGASLPPVDTVQVDISCAGTKREKSQHALRKASGAAFRQRPRTTRTKS